MSDIFQEVDEEVRRDKAAEFWKKYQNQILAAAVLIVLASAGFRYWQYERERATQAAGDQAKAGLDKIAAQGPSGYRALAQMTAAGAEAAKDPQAAIAAFDAVAGDAAIDPLMRDTARLRAAFLRVDISAEQQKGEAALTALSAAGGPYRRVAALALGALALERKDYDDASKQFDLVLGDPEVSSGERQAASRWLGLIASNRSAAAK